VVVKGTLGQNVACALWRRLPHLPRSAWQFPIIYLQSTIFPLSLRLHNTISMSDATDQPKKERFAPKEPVTLQPPKDDIIDRDHLAKCDGMRSSV
jgi:hypothetical protein